MAYYKFQTDEIQRLEKLLSDTVQTVSTDDLHIQSVEEMCLSCLCALPLPKDIVSKGFNDVIFNLSEEEFNSDPLYKQQTSGIQASYQAGLTSMDDDSIATELGVFLNIKDICYNGDLDKFMLFFSKFFEIQNTLNFKTVLCDFEKDGKVKDDYQARLEDFYKELIASGLSLWRWFNIVLYMKKMLDISSLSGEASNTPSRINHTLALCWCIDNNKELNVAYSRWANGSRINVRTIIDLQQEITVDYANNILGYEVYWTFLQYSYINQQGLLLSYLLHVFTTLDEEERQTYFDIFYDSPYNAEIYKAWSEYCNAQGISDEECDAIISLRDDNREHGLDTVASNNNDKNTYFDIPEDFFSNPDYVNGQASSAQCRSLYETYWNVSSIKNLVSYVADQQKFINSDSHTKELFVLALTKRSKEPGMEFSKISVNDVTSSVAGISVIFRKLCSDANVSNLNQLFIAPNKKEGKKWGSVNWDKKHIFENNLRGYLDTLFPQHPS